MGTLVERMSPKAARTCHRRSERTMMVSGGPIPISFMHLLDFIETPTSKLSVKHVNMPLMMPAVPQTPSSSIPGKQGLSHGARDSPATKQRRLSLAAIFSWKKLKVSPVVTTVTSDEVGIVKALQRLDLHSQWSNLPDHLLESILILMKDGDKDDWGHVQVVLLDKLKCLQ